MIQLFKIKKRKVWHVTDKKETGSVCNSASTHNPNISRDIANRRITDIDFKEYTSKPDMSYIDVLAVSEIPHEIHDELCKACVQQAFAAGQVRIVARKRR